jgi:hypothetical protein
VRENQREGRRKRNGPARPLLHLAGYLGVWAEGTFGWGWKLQMICRSVRPLNSCSAAGIYSPYTYVIIQIATVKAGHFSILYLLVGSGLTDDSSESPPPPLAVLGFPLSYPPKLDPLFRGGGGGGAKTPVLATLYLHFGL